MTGNIIALNNLIKLLDIPTKDYIAAVNRYISTIPEDKVCVFDFDGCITDGLKPRVGDIICTGRCFDEREVVFNKLKELGLNPLDFVIYFNPIKLETRGSFNDKARICSAKHKRNIIESLYNNGVEIHSIFEDDPLQMSRIMEGFELIHDKFIFIRNNREDY